MSETKSLKVYGTLYVGDKEYYLLHPRPLTKFDSWASDFHVFFVCKVINYPATATHLVVHGDWFIDYSKSGDSINVQVDTDLFEQVMKGEATDGYIEDNWLGREFDRAVKLLQSAEAS